MGMTPTRFIGSWPRENPVQIGAQAVAVVTTVPLSSIRSGAHGRVVLNFGDGSPEQSVTLESPPSSSKYRVLATGEVTQQTRAVYTYPRAGTFTIAVAVFKDIYGYGERLDGGGTASVTVVPLLPPAPLAPTPDRCARTRDSCTRNSGPGDSCAADSGTTNAATRHASSGNARTRDSCTRNSGPGDSCAADSGSGNPDSRAAHAGPVDASAADSGSNSDVLRPAGSHPAALGDTWELYRPA